MNGKTYKRLSFFKNPFKGNIFCTKTAFISLAKIQKNIEFYYLMSMFLDTNNNKFSNIFYISRSTK